MSVVIGVAAGLVIGFVAGLWFAARSFGKLAGQVAMKNCDSAEEALLALQKVGLG